MSSCQFKNYGNDMDIFGAITMFAYWKTTGSLTQSQAKRLRESKTIDEFIIEELKGSSFDNLPAIANKNDIMIEVYYKKQITYECGSSDNIMRLITMMPNSLHKLKLCTNIQQLVYKPKEITMTWTDYLLRENINTKDIPSIETLLGKNIIIHSKKPFVKNSHYDKKRPVTLQLRKSMIHSTSINLHQCHLTKELFVIDNFDSYNTNKRCVKQNCNYKSNQKNNLQRHESSNICQKGTQINIKQLEYGNVKPFLERLVDQGDLSKMPKNQNHICFDIESMLLPVNMERGMQTITYEHSMCSIGVCSHINGKYNDDWFVIKDNSYDEKLILMQKFVSFIIKEKESVKINKELEQLIESLDERLLKLKEDNDHQTPEISRLATNINQLKKYTKVSVFGFNSQRYDIKVMLNPLLEALMDHYKLEDITILCRGTAYFSIETPDFWMKDVMNYSNPTNLDGYLKSWTKECIKWPYPYTYFKSIDAMKQCTQFPDFSNFECPEDLYNKGLDKFNHHMNLPDGTNEKWYSFLDYLKYYNLSDVIPLSVAIRNSFEEFESVFGVDMFSEYSLPAFAQSAVMKLYNKAVPNLFSPPKRYREITEIYRKNCYGGICNVYHRHISLNDDDAPHAAKYNNKGEKWQSIHFFDVNSLYPSTYIKDMPTGRGFSWTKEGSCFKKKLMCDENISLISLMAMDELNKDPKFINRNGERVRIINGWYQSERRFGDYPVDGWAQVDEKLFIIQFDGCWTHPCYCSTGKKLNRYRRAIEQDQKRNDYLTSLGEYIIIKECEFKKTFDKYVMPLFISLLLYKGI